MPLQYDKRQGIVRILTYHPIVRNATSGEDGFYITVSPFGAEVEAAKMACTMSGVAYNPQLHNRLMVTSNYVSHN